MISTRSVRRLIAKDDEKHLILEFLFKISLK